MQVALAPSLWSNSPTLFLRKPVQKGATLVEMVPNWTDEPDASKIQLTVTVTRQSKPEAKFCAPLPSLLHHCHLVREDMWNDTWLKVAEHSTPFVEVGLEIVFPGPYKVPSLRLVASQTCQAFTGELVRPVRLVEEGPRDWNGPKTLNYINIY